MNCQTTSLISTTASTIISPHNSLINVPIHYQKTKDFKTRRSSSEPANEQKLLAHAQNSHNISSINQNTCISKNDTVDSNGLVVDDGSDDNFCLHQKKIKVS